MSEIRQELRDHAGFGRSRRRRPGNRGIRVHLRRAEVLGRRARARTRRDRGRVHRAHAGSRGAVPGRSGGRLRHAGAATDRARGADAGAFEHQQRAEDEGRSLRCRPRCLFGGRPPALAVDLPAASACSRTRSSGRCSPSSAWRAWSRREVGQPRLRAHGRAFLAQPRNRRLRGVTHSPVGNLYVNRQITGAMVGRQPFGGRRLSGTGFQGRRLDYLLQFTDPQVVTEDTVRHGPVVTADRPCCRRR